MSAVAARTMAASVATTTPARTRLLLDSGSRAWVLASAATALLPLLLQLPGTLIPIAVAAGVLTAWLSWRRPMPTLLKLVLALGVLAAVFWTMGPRFGRDTGCALLAVMLAIKPTETATLRDGRSLVGFALFAPFAAFLLDQGPASMGLGLLAVLCALVTLQRLADLEAGVPAAATPLTGKLWQVGKLVLIGLPLGLSVFWLFPRLGQPIWGVPERALARPGLSDRMTPGEWIDLMADDTPAARAQFFGPAPSAQQMYWRGPVLTDFDGRSWTRSPWHDGAAIVAAARQGPHWDYQIEIEATDRRQLVALDLPLSVPDGARLDGDYSLSSTRRLNALTRWRLRSAAPAQFDPQLSPLQRRQALQLPPGFNPRTAALARQWRSEAGGDDAAIVNRALRWIRAEFAYTLDTPLPGRDGVDEFLFRYKQGFCEHFSSAFVVLMRGAGIPARVVTGYAGGVRNPFGGYWVIRRMDAHAWAEVWLPQRGWVRVDPTAAVAPERIYDTLEDRLGAGGSGLQGGLTTLGDVSDWLRRGWNDLVLGFDAERQQQLLRPLGFGRLDGAQLGGLFAACALLVLLGMMWLLSRGERERDPLLRAWHRMSARYARLGLAREPHEPALQWAQRVARARPQGGQVLLALSRRFAESRYAAAVGDTAALQRDLHRHRP